MLVGELEFIVRGSIGIALGSRHGPTIDLMLARADQALSSAKSAGGNRAVVCDAAIDRAPQPSFDLEAALHNALERGEMRLHYQPVVDPRARRLPRVEALIRWQRGERLLPPAEFISLAEETGVVFELGEWAIAEALQQVARWRLRGVPVETVSVNVHARHLEQAGLVQAVARALAATRLEPSCLELELTETGVMKDVDGALERLQGLRQLGVRMALDDFGTGYSSLSYLTQLPIDTLKIDRSFVRQLGGGRQSEAVVRSILALANALGLSTVAEGVESREQLHTLLSLGCQHVQGYLFARPMPAEELTRWWHAYSRGPRSELGFLVPPQLAAGAAARSTGAGAASGAASGAIVLPPPRTAPGGPEPIYI